MKTKFENWKNGRYIVQRNDQGKFITYRKQKGSGIKSVKQANEILNKTGTFRVDTVRIGVKRVKANDILSRTKIGKNTIILRTNKPLKKENYYQYVTSIYWIKARKTTIGFSNMRSNKEESTKRAIQGAIRLGIISYEWTVDIDNLIATPPEADGKPVRFTIKHEVSTYVKSTGKWA